MSSELRTNTIVPASGTNLTLGGSGDTTKIPSGSTLDVDGTADISGAFNSVGIDDNATSTTLSLSSSNQVEVSNSLTDYSFKVINDGNSTSHFGIYVQCGEDSGSGTNYLMGFKDGDGGSVGSITFSGTTTSFNTSSDYRLKEDVTPMTGAIDKLKQLNPVNFAWIGNGVRADGFLAHELKEVVSNAVVGEKDGKEMQGIDQSKLIPLLTSALQEAIQRIEELESA